MWRATLVQPQRVSLIGGECICSINERFLRSCTPQPANLTAGCSFAEDRHCGEGQGGKISREP